MADWIEFVAACGHKTTAKQLGQICPQCFLETHETLASLRAQLAEAQDREPSKSQIKRISAMVESAEIKRLEAEAGRLREAIAWVCGEDIEGWPPFDSYTTAGYRYRWRTVLRERLALQGEG